MSKVEDVRKNMMEYSKHGMCSTSTQPKIYDMQPKKIS